jgi:hypothetical protein
MMPAIVAPSNTAATTSSSAAAAASGAESGADEVPATQATSRVPPSSASSSSGSSVSVGDDLGPSSDEIKVFSNEGDDDRSENSTAEGLQADGELVEEKKSLITESEQVSQIKVSFFCAHLVSALPPAAAVSLAAAVAHFAVRRRAAVRNQRNSSPCNLCASEL